MKSRIVITMKQDHIQSIQISPRLADNLEVITKSINQPDENESHMTLVDEKGIRCTWQKWDANQFEMLSDDTHQLIDQIFQSPT